MQSTDVQTPMAIWYPVAGRKDVYVRYLMMEETIEVDSSLEMGGRLKR